MLPLPKKLYKLYMEGNKSNLRHNQSGGSPHCRICMNESESIIHVIAACSGMASVSKKLLEELRQLCLQTRNKINLSEISEDEKNLCQFILDPSSLNLKTRVSLSDPAIHTLFKFSREYCYTIDKTRIGLLQEIDKNKHGLS